MDNDIYHLGAWFRQVRKDRGYTLTQVAGKNFSPAALSRFERGETDIRGDHLTAIMLNLGIVGADLANYQRMNPYTFPRDAIDAMFAMDADTLQQVRTDYAAAHVKEEHNPLLPIVDEVLAMYALAPDADFRMPAATEQRLIELLAYPNTWGTFEYAVITGCLRFGSVDFIRAVWQYAQAIVGPNVLYKAIATAWVLIYAKVRDIPDVAAASAVVAQDLMQDDEKTYYTAENYPVLKFGVLVYEWNKKQTRAREAKVKAAIDGIRLLGSVRLSAYLAKVWRLFTNGTTGWRQQSHVPDPNLISVNDMSEGKKIALFRRIRGFSLNQAAVAWSKSSQLRVENENVTPGITTLMRSSALLLMDYSNISIINSDINLLYDYMDEIHDLALRFALRKEKVNRIRTILERVADKITSPFIDDLRDEFEYAVSLLAGNAVNTALENRYYKRICKINAIHTIDVNVAVTLYEHNPSSGRFPLILDALQRIDAAGYTKMYMINRRVIHLADSVVYTHDLTNGQRLVDFLAKLTDLPSPTMGNRTLMLTKLMADALLDPTRLTTKQYAEYLRADAKYTIPLQRVNMPGVFSLIPGALPE